MFMLPAATSCRSGFHRCVRLRSMSVICARCFFPRRSPSRVTSSSPPAPPPTITTRCAALLLGDRAATEEDLGKMPVPLVPLVERDRPIDERVGKLVERAVDRDARRNAVARLDDLLSLARQDEVREELRRVGM